MHPWLIVHTTNLPKEIVELLTFLDNTLDTRYFRESSCPLLDQSFYRTNDWLNSINKGGCTKSLNLLCGSPLDRI